MADERPFFGGMPYGPDVRRLEEAFPVTELTEGKVIEHEMLSGVLDLKRGTQRYYGVINAWRSRVRNSNGVILEWQPGDGLKVLDPAGVLDCSENRTRQKIKQLCGPRAIGMFAWVDRARLDDVGRRRFDHQARVVRALKDAVIEKRRELAIELAPVKSLPKPKIA